MGDPKLKVPEAMFCLMTANYLFDLRDGLIEISQILQDTLFEMDTNDKLAAAEETRQVLKILR